MMARDQLFEQLSDYARQHPRLREALARVEFRVVDERGVLAAEVDGWLREMDRRAELEGATLTNRGAEPFAPGARHARLEAPKTLINDAAWFMRHGTEEERTAIKRYWVNHLEKGSTRVLIALHLMGRMVRKRATDHPAEDVARALRAMGDEGRARRAASRG